jgi:hypothetical protein
VLERQAVGPADSPVGRELPWRSALWPVRRVGAVERKASTSGGPTLGESAAASPGLTRKDRQDGARGRRLSALSSRRPVDLAFENAESVAGGKDLDLMRGLGLQAEREEVEQRADDAAGPGSWRSGPCGRRRLSGSASSAAATSDPRSSFLNGTGRFVRVIPLAEALADTKASYDRAVRDQWDRGTIRRTRAQAREGTPGGQGYSCR